MVVRKWVDILVGQGNQNDIIILDILLPIEITIMRWGIDCHTYSVITLVTVLLT